MAVLALYHATVPVQSDTFVGCGRMFVQSGTEFQADGNVFV